MPDELTLTRRLERIERILTRIDERLDALDRRVDGIPDSVSIRISASWSERFHAMLERLRDVEEKR